jgi:hypothetical protein
MSPKYYVIKLLSSLKVKKVTFYLLLIVFPLLIFVDANAQTGGIIWDEPFNVSKSDSTSTDPFLLADPAGYVHLFWGEKQSEQPTNNPDTLMYTRWNGSSWSEPVDIFFSPEEHGNQIVQYPHAVIDSKGHIHLIWLTQPNFPNYALFYSSVHSSEASFASAWQPITVLAEDLTGTNYSIDIKSDAFDNIHIIYSRVPGGDNATELRSVSYVKSKDGGLSWTNSVDIHTISDPKRGASNNRLLVDSNGNLFTTWSEWDQSGNGQAILFSRSMDNGDSWENTKVLTKRIGREYERDWNSIALIDDDQLVSIWEGGWRAYRNAMYTYDNGESWTEPVDAFPGVIGENGFVEFDRDSNGTLHMFFANRTREGNTLKTGEGLWHSIWEGNEMWREPRLSSPNINMLNPKAVIVLGNQVMTTWYTGADREIITMSGRIMDAAEEPAISWPLPLDDQQITITPTITALATKTPDTYPTVPDDPEITSDPNSPKNQPYQPNYGLFFGVSSSILVIMGLVIIKKVFWRN